MLDDEDTISDVSCLRENKAIHNFLSNRDVYFVFVFRLRCNERVIRIGIVPNGRGDNPLLTNFRRACKIAKSDCVNFVMSACTRLSFHPSIRPQRTSRLPMDGFSWNLIFEYFSKTCRKYSSLITI